MTTLKLKLRDDVTAFRPGELLVGGVAWELDRPAKALEIRLFHFTKGKGTPDIAVIATHRIIPSGAPGLEKFEFHLPAGPYSFSGALISLIWAVEAVLLPKNVCERLEFVLSPTGQEIQLASLGAPKDLISVQVQGLFGWLKGRKRS